MKKLMWILVAVFAGLLWLSRSNPEFKAMKQRDAVSPSQASSVQPAKNKDGQQFRLAIRRHLRETLKDYDSVKNLVFSEPQELDGAVRMRVAFSARNSFGGYEKADRLYTFPTNTQTFTFQDLTK